MAGARPQGKRAMDDARTTPADDRPRKRPTGPHALGLVAALACAVALHAGLGDARDWRPAFVMNDEQREQVNNSPFALILGDLRVTAADLMWIETERYLHRGVGFAPHVHAQELAPHEPADADHAGKSMDEPVPNHEHDHEQGHDHGHGGLTPEEEFAGMKPLIPAAEGDDRGFIGTIQRHIQPWQDANAPHHHDVGDELIPWYRVLTLSNPHHVRGFLTGAWWLMQQEDREPGSLAQALDFIDEGIAHNPRASQLHLMRGRILIQERRWPEAIAAFRRSAGLALAIRPPGGVERAPDWTDWEEEDFSAAVHYVPTLCYLKLKDPAATREALEWASRLLPGDARLARLRDRFLADPRAGQIASGGE
jgi:hypothetical protein